MKWVTQIFTASELKKAAALGESEFILAPKDLSRFGGLSRKGVTEILSAAEILQVSLFLQADLIVSEPFFEDYIHQIKAFPLEKFQAIRISDPGVARRLLKDFKVKIHLILEEGCRNLETLLSFYRYFEGRCTRIVLPYEVPGNPLRTWIREIDCETELLGLGRIPVFYSMRKLLSPMKIGEQEGGRREALAFTPHIKNKGGFKVLENSHGTFLFFPKDLFLLEYQDELEKSGLSHFRVDRYFDEDPSILALLRQANKLKKAWKTPLIHAFYKANKTDSSFRNLKNFLRENRNEAWVGEVLESAKEKYLVFEAFSRIKQGDKIVFLNPLGDQIPYEMTGIRSLSGRMKKRIEKGEICLIDYTPSLSSRSYAYRLKKEERIQKDKTKQGQPY